MMIYQVTNFACILGFFLLKKSTFSPSDCSLPSLILGLGVSLSEGKQLTIGSGVKVISRMNIQNESEQIFIGSASTADGSSKNVVKGEKILIFFISIALNS